VSERPLVEVGRITRPHGLRGEVVVVLTTDRDERVAVGSRLETDRGPLLVASSRREQRKGLKRHTGQYTSHWVVAFDGYAGRDAAEALRDLILRAEPIDDPDALWVDDLVGTKVSLASTGESVGTCVAVLANPASDLLELDSGALVPVVFITSHTADTVVIDPPDGLFDL
jgi:16S rRNA processing protein RimM